jgi:N-acetylmuramoyl-L-alanine amidase
MRYGIDIGHNCPPDTGARGIRFEDDLTKEVGNLVIAKLKSLGHQVIECKPTKASTVGDSLRKRCATANINNVELYVSIHFNSFNGKANGTEVFAISSKGRKIALSVLEEIVKLGFFNRGVKNGSHLYVLRNTNMTAILIECCFVDSRKDMDLYNPEAMANSIVKGLTGQPPTNSVEPIPDEEQNPDVTLQRLQKALNRLQITDKDGQPLKEDTINEAKTRSAVEKFQKIVGIQQTGVADQNTWNAINQILAKRIIRVNHAGGAVVRYLQHRLEVEIDGIYGPLSEAAVKKFQSSHGLTADGIVGPMTWEKLIG